ncbi:hypothetical protein swp_0729 [Shewanella piezotolerans WP3]|uniref:Uncharacterized protein n=1 Tax=Shewanella piezotolerans (strain WP3 / JCM 13877) TaxID=225849 RepID=B8CIR8_SHEPW|nr:hypothetical protein [Shewanella piezotolerans]ACJ27544.1 hypothetical protein swp_0729 [Shewanella piezotolerans WP3]
MTIKQQIKKPIVSAWKPIITKTEYTQVKGGDLIQLISSDSKVYKVCSAFDSAIAEGSNPIAVFQDLSSKGQPCFWLEKQPPQARRSNITLADNAIVKFHGQYFTLEQSEGSLQLCPIAPTLSQLNSLDDIKLALSKARERSAEQAKLHYPLVRSRGISITAYGNNGLPITSFKVTKFTCKHQLDKAIIIAKADHQIETISLSGGYDGLNSIGDPHATPLVSQFSLPVWSKTLGYLNIIVD